MCITKKDGEKVILTYPVPQSESNAAKGSGDFNKHCTCSNYYKSLINSCRELQEKSNQIITEIVDDEKSKSGVVHVLPDKGESEFSESSDEGSEEDLKTQPQVKKQKS